MLKKITVTRDEYAPLERRFAARAEGQSGYGETVGDALNELDTRIGPPNEMRVIIVQCFVPDEFFTADDQNRLRELMTARKTALAAGRELPEDQWSELQALIDKELEGTGRRASAVGEAIAT